jgi:hypothetical protein
VVDVSERVTPIKRGTAERLGLRKPARTYLYSRDGLTPDPKRRWATGPTLDEATAGADRMIEWAQQYLGVELAPWQRSTLERYYMNRL